MHVAYMLVFIGLRGVSPGVLRALKCPRRRCMFPALRPTAWTVLGTHRVAVHARDVVHARFVVSACQQLWCGINAYSGVPGGMPVVDT
jgi:hypothetical protein